MYIHLYDSFIVSLSEPPCALLFDQWVSMRISRHGEKGGIERDRERERGIWKSVDFSERIRCRKNILWEIYSIAAVAESVDHHLEVHDKIFHRVRDTGHTEKRGCKSVQIVRHEKYYKMQPLDARREGKSFEQYST